MILKLVLALTLVSTLQAEETPKVEVCSGDLKMIVTGLKNSDGQIKFDLDNSKVTFKPQKNGPPAFRKGRSPITDKRVEYIFKDIPCGEYAVKLYHDENMNQDFDKFLKIPKEEYGFSNCKGCILPPSFDKAKFLFDKEHPTVTIEL